MKTTAVVISFLCVSIPMFPGRVQATNDFDEAGDGDLANVLNWSEGSPPAPDALGFMLGAGDVETFLSSDLTTGELQFFRPFGQFSIDLQNHTLTSDLLNHLPTPFASFEPKAGGLSVRNGTVQSNLKIEVAGLNLQPQSVSAVISNVEWSGEKWEILGKPSTPGPGFEQAGKVNVTIDQGSKVTVDNLSVGVNGTVNVSGPDAELSFKQAIIAGFDPQNISIADLFQRVATLRAEDGATIRTLETNPAIVGNPIEGLLVQNNQSAAIRTLDLDGADTRMLAPDANIVIVDLQISNGAAVETNRPLYIGAQVEITNATASNDFVSILPSSIVGSLAAGTGLEHVVRLTNATLNGDVTGFRFVDLNDGVLNGDIKGAEAVRGEGVVNGDMAQHSGLLPPYGGFLPTGLIDVNGNVERGVFMSVLLTGPPDENTPRVEVDSINGESTFDWTFLPFPGEDTPFGAWVDFDPQFHASVGDRYELLTTIDTVLNPGYVTPGDLATLSPPLLTLVKERLAQVGFRNTPTGYQFDVFIEPHAIGFTVVAVPEVSSFGLLVIVVLAGASARACRVRARQS